MRSRMNEVSQAKIFLSSKIHFWSGIQTMARPNLPRHFPESSKNLHGIHISIFSFDTVPLFHCDNRNDYDRAVRLFDTTKFLIGVHKIVVMSNLEAF